MQLPPDSNVRAEENAQSTKQSWLGTLLYCGFCFPFFLLCVFVVRDFMFIAVSGFFALWGVLYLVLMVRMSLGQAKFGELNLLLEHPAPSIGGRLTGSVRLPAAALAAKQLTAKLTLYRMEPDDKGQLTETAFWGTTQHFPIHRKEDGGGARLAIDIPADQQPTRDEKPGETIDHPAPGGYWKWDMQLTAEVPGLDLDRTFPIVVLPAQPGAAVVRAEPQSRPPSAMPQAAFARPVPAAAKPIAAAQVATVAEAPAPGLPEEEKPTDNSPTWVLIAANLVPVAGVALWGWKVHEVVFLYWMEAVFVGAFNVLRIIVSVPRGLAEMEARGIAPTAGEALGGKLMLASFFLIHYGGFCFFAGEGVLSMFPSHQFRDLIPALREVLREPGIALSVLAIAGSHGYSFLRNYQCGDYLDANFAELMTRPYKRVLAPLLFAFFGGALFVKVEASVAAMVVFVAIKIALDVHAHVSQQ